MSVATDRHAVRAIDGVGGAGGRHPSDRGGAPAVAASPASSANRPGTPSLLQRLRHAIRILHRIIGAPDYEGYLAHAARCHPDRPPLSRDEFVRQRLEDRYSRPGSRCC